jgi:hypothetical protein
VIFQQNQASFVRMITSNLAIALAPLYKEMFLARSTNSFKVFETHPKAEEYDIIEPKLNN